MRNINEIIIHCSDTRPGWMQGTTCKDKVAEIRRWHKTERNPRFIDIGYHYIIDRDGTIERGRDDRTVGAHCYGNNKCSLGVCLLGGHGGSSNDRFRDNFTEEQDAALKELLVQLRAEYNIKTIRGHNDVPDAGKSCPCFKVKRWLKQAEPAKKPVPSNKKVNLAKSTSIKGNLTNIISGGGLATAAATYQGFGDVEKYVILGAGIFILIVGLWLFRNKLLKLADQHGL